MVDVDAVVMYPNIADTLQASPPRRGPTELAPLGPGDALDLFSRELGTRPGPRLRALLAEAGGNPFYVSELARSLTRDGSLIDRGGEAELRTGGAEPPASLAAVLHRRLGLLSDETHSLL